MSALAAAPSTAPAVLAIRSRGSGTRSRGICATSIVEVTTIAPPTTASQDSHGRMLGDKTPYLSSFDSVAHGTGAECDIADHSKVKQCGDRKRDRNRPCHAGCWCEYRGHDASGSRGGELL